ncbi:MAG: hypothetical protein ACRENE_15965, partial [Polyangiaceae bacterium]
VIPAIREGHIARAPGASNLGLFAGLGPGASLVPIGVIIVGAFVTATRLAARAQAEPPVTP